MSSYFHIEERLGYNVGKRVLDFALASLACILLLPLALLVAIAIKATSKGPVLFKQTRIGKGGKPFTMLKFRTMVHDSDSTVHQEHMRRIITDSSVQPMHKITDDPRITGLGRFLRAYKVDELPQLLNVLSGSMSLVGPRPPIPYEVEMYNKWHMNRLCVKPGITGMWQVYGGNQTHFDKMIQLDLDYIRNRSLLLDLRILARTIVAVLPD